jgi:L-alanine-DL-glutamate epimerase-like enolase superfamily enzyme
MKLRELTLRKVRLPLIRPYVLSYRTFTEFEPIIVEARDSDGRIGWGEGHISPGSSGETREGGWAFCREHAAAIVGKDTYAAGLPMKNAFHWTPLAMCARLAPAARVRNWAAL